MLIGLEELAHETSSEKRRELLNRVTAMFLDGAENHTDRESTLYADVVLQVLDEVGLNDRVEYSTSIADVGAVPRAVVRRLAGDAIEVATPVLVRSPVLSDDDLVDIAEKASQDHLHAISGRKSLSEDVTDTLIRRGDERVMRTISGNEGARFSTSGLTRLTEHSADDVTVRRNILTRNDLRRQLIDKVLPIVSADYADQLREMISKVDDGTIDFVVDAAEKGVRKEKANAARQRLETKAVINELMSNSCKIDDVLVEFLAQGRIADIATIVSKLSQVPENVVSNVFFKTNNEPVAILLRAIGATTTGFKAVQDMRAQKLRFPNSHYQQGMRDFSNLNEQTAKRSLRFVKVRAAVA